MSCLALALPRPRSQRLPEMKLLPAPNWLMVRTQWLLQPWQRVMRVLYFREMIFSRGSMLLWGFPSFRCASAI